jgi:hypothetical protein
MAGGARSGHADRKTITAGRAVKRGLLSSSIEERTKVRSRKTRSQPWNQLALKGEIPHLYPLPFAKEAKHPAANSKHTHSQVRWLCRCSRLLYSDRPLARLQHGKTTTLHSRSIHSIAASTWTCVVSRTGRPAAVGSRRINDNSVPPRIKPSTLLRPFIASTMSIKALRV